MGHHVYDIDIRPKSRRRHLRFNRPILSNFPEGIRAARTKEEVGHFNKGMRNPVARVAEGNSYDISGFFNIFNAQPRVAYFFPDDFYSVLRCHFYLPKKASIQIPDTRGDISLGTRSPREPARLVDRARSDELRQQRAVYRGHGAFGIQRQCGDYVSCVFGAGLY